ncbi:unnamed protein product, partial [Schistosoma turkestanicum]
TKAKCLASHRTTAHMLMKPSLSINNHKIHEKPTKHVSCTFISTNSLSRNENTSPPRISSSSSSLSSSHYWNQTHKLYTTMQLTAESTNNMNLLRKKIETQFIQWILDMLTRADFES